MSSRSKSTGVRTETQWYDDEPTAFPYRTGEYDRPRLGWSLVVAAICQLVIATAAIVTGAAVVGVISTVALAGCGALLVGAEAGARRQRAQSRRMEAERD